MDLTVKELHMKKVSSLLFVAAASIFATGAKADDSSDSNADASRAFASTLEQSKAVIIRVPVDAQGQEDSTRAEMRVHVSDGSVASSTDVAGAFDKGIDAKTAPVLPSGAGDSSTSHRDSWGWDSWNGNGGYSYNHDYYNNYQPTYHCGSHYNYTYAQPVYYYYSYPQYISGYWEFHPYHYYYYGRGW